MKLKWFFKDVHCVSALVLGAKISQTYKQPGRRRVRRTSAASHDKSGVAVAIVKKTPLPLLQIIVKRCETKQAFLTAKVCAHVTSSTNM